MLFMAFLGGFMLITAVPGGASLFLPRQISEGAPGIYPMLARA
jgi:hypothetical protein